MILIPEQFPHNQFKSNYKNQMLLDYKNDLINYNKYWYENYYDKNKKFTNQVTKLIIYEADFNNITYPIIKHNLKINISLSTICRRVKKTNIFVQNLPKEKIKILPTDYIYIQSDESYNNLIDNKKK